MKSVFWIFTTLFSLASMAQSFPDPMPEKIYFFHDFSVQAKKRYETVYTATKQGRDRLKELQQNDYTCQSKGNEISLCSAFLSPNETEIEIATKVEKLLSQMPIQFLKMQGEPFLISEAPLLTEWSIPQGVLFKGKQYSSYRFLRTSNLDKIFLGEFAEETFVFDDSEGLSYSVQYTRTESPKAYFVYFVLAKYR